MDAKNIDLKQLTIKEVQTIKNTFGLTDAQATIIFFGRDYCENL